MNDLELNKAIEEARRHLNELLEIQTRRALANSNRDSYDSTPLPLDIPVSPGPFFQPQFPPYWVTCSENGGLLDVKNEWVGSKAK